MFSKTARMFVTSTAGLLILIGPLAFPRDCSMDSCCCVIDDALDVAFSSNACCGCGVMEQASIPAQPAEFLNVTHHENIRPEADIDYEEPASFTADIDLSFRSIEGKSLSPPSYKSRINIPLIC
jgi:hypothetical protein